MKAGRTILLAGAGFIAVAPFLWLLSTSLKGAEELFVFPPRLLPSTIVWENYTGVWNAIPLGTYFVNSFLVTGACVLGNILFSSLAGFALARYQFRYRTGALVCVLAAMMVPREVILLPLYTTILRMHLADSLAGVVLPSIVDGMGIFLMRQAFLAIPKEIEEAGIMDGASPLRLWWNVMVPMTRPALATLTILTVIAAWGDFLWPLIVLKSPEHFTVQVGLSYMMGTFVDNFRYVAAGAVLSLLPVMVVFIGMQKHFERGLFAGSNK